MKKLINIMLLFSIIIFVTQCSEDNEVIKEQHKPFTIEFTFNVDNADKKVIANFIYNESLQHYALVSDELSVIEAKDEKTNELVYVYTYKQTNNIVNGRTEWSIKTGYYGYSGGCWYWGTLYTGDNGDSIFTMGNQAYNPPLCQPGVWAYIYVPKPYLIQLNPKPRKPVITLPYPF